MSKKRKFRSQAYKLDDLYGFEADLVKESDRGLVLLIAAFLDEGLRDLLANYFVDDEEQVNWMLNELNGPLGTFSARIKMCYCLGLFGDKELNNFDTIRKIRNEFAHGLQGISLSDEMIIQLLNKLDFPKLVSSNDYPPREILFDAGFYLSGLIKGIKSTLKKKSSKK